MADPTPAPRTGPGPERSPSGGRASPGAGDRPPEGRLYVCGTPIGNLEDVTLRLLRVLGEADRIAAEDTRRTMKLLSHHGIRVGGAGGAKGAGRLSGAGDAGRAGGAKGASVPGGAGEAEGVSGPGRAGGAEGASVPGGARLVSYHQANEHARVPELVKHMRDGERIALVTDAGMPGISDPGYLLVDACIREGIPVEVVPGPSAVTSAVAVSGLPTERFTFEGFLPRKQGERRRRLAAAGAQDRTLVVFESPARIRRTLEEVRDVLGERRIAVARELTKLHEEVLRGTVSEVIEAIGPRQLKGEIVLLVEGTTRGSPPPSELLP